MSFEVPFLRVKPLSTPTYWSKTILSRLWLQTAPSFLCPKRVTLSHQTGFARMAGGSSALPPLKSSLGVGFIQTPRLLLTSSILILQIRVQDWVDYSIGV